MHGQNIAGALAMLGQRLESALVGGDDTREIRREMAAIEQRERSAAAKAEAQERALRAAAEAEEQAEIDGRATALLDGSKARIAEALAPLALATAQTIRRYPDGRIETVETVEHNHGGLT